MGNFRNLHVEILHFNSQVCSNGLVENFSISNRQAKTVAEILAYEIYCRHESQEANIG